MDAQEMTRQIVKGQENLERMKREIFMVVEVLLLIIKGQKGAKRTRNTQKVIRSRSDQCRWEIFSLRDGSVSLRCWVKKGNISINSFSMDTNGNCEIGLGLIETIHDNLPMLVALMIRQFPTFERELEPIIKASTKEF